MSKTIKLTIRGTAVFTTLDGKKVKAVLTTDQKSSLKELVEKYNAKPSDYWAKRIKKFFPEDKPKVERIKKKAAKNKLKEVKKTKKAIKKTKTAKSTATSTTDQVEEIAKNGVFKEIKPTIGANHRNPEW